jgi:hypothetical protein
MVVSSVFYQSPGPPPLGDARGIVPAHRCGHQNGQQSWPIFYRRFICCCPGGRWGNAEQIVARWWHPVASRVALDMLHRAIPSVLLRRTAVAIKTTNNGGAFVRHSRLFCIIIHSCKTMLWSIKTNAKLQY